MENSNNSNNKKQNENSENAVNPTNDVAYTFIQSLNQQASVISPAKTSNLSTPTGKPYYELIYWIYFFLSKI